MMRRNRTLLRIAVFFAPVALGFAVVALVPAGEVRLKNGLRLEGHPAPIQSLTAAAPQSSSAITSYPIVMLETGMKRYFVPVRQVLAANRDSELAEFEIFTLEQRKSGPLFQFQAIGSFAQSTPFDEFGRREVTLNTAIRPLKIRQGITQIHPKYVTVTGLNCVWEYGIATTSIPPATLDAMIRHVTDQSNPQDRLAIARFYLQAGMYPQSQRELDAILADFPELKDRVNELTLQVRELVGSQLIVELRRRRDAGQHSLAYTAASQFPSERMSGEVLRNVRELIASYREARELIEKCRMLLGDLQAQLKDKHDAEATAAYRSEIAEHLNTETLTRLDPFLKLESDPSLSAEEKLALAYSGWVAGAAHAVTDLDTAMHMWEARFLILEYLRSETDGRRQQILAQLHNLEGVGFETVLRLIPGLSPITETPDLEPGKPITIEVTNPWSEGTDADAADADSDATRPVRYTAVLPLEYHSDHRYPAIVALHAAGASSDRELLWWCGTQDRPLQAQRRGYIVLSPEYAATSQRQYDYGTLAHDVVVPSLRDAQRRFSIDSDRVFLAGHGTGGDAAFDIGMSHPDLFAGIIPITGVINEVCKYYWQNARPLSWYVVAGERDGDSFDRNAFQLNRMLRSGFDLIYAEYVGRGRETFYGEIHHLFDWMDLHRRPQIPKEVDVRILRPTDNQFYWVRVDGLPANLAPRPTEPQTTSRTRTTRPMILEARIAPGDTDRNAIQIRSGADRTTIWLNPELVDFDKRVAVRINGRTRFNDFIRPNLEALLEDLRIRGDRQRLFWTRLAFD